MLIEKLNDEEASFLELLHDPQVLCECLFDDELNNLDSVQNFSEDKYCKIRLYQIPFLSYEYLLADDEQLSKLENFKLKKGAGSAYVFCGRKIGKSLISLLMDLLLDSLHNYKDWVSIFSSFDEDHVNNILEPYIKAMKKHPFFKLLNCQVKRKPTTVILPTGHMTKGINMALSGREPGSNFESQHAQKMYLDEAQYEIDEVLKRRSQAVSEFGAIERLAGITAFSATSPAGKIFFNLDKRNWLVNIPQTVSPFWTNDTKKQAIADFGDMTSFGYRIHCLAEVIQDLEGLYDIERCRKCYTHNEKKTVRNFDVSKDTFHIFKERIIIERPNWCKRAWLAFDFGVSAPTEAIIIFESEKKDDLPIYRYMYNITLNRLIPDEQTEIFTWLINKLNIDVIAGDSTELGGQQVLHDLEKIMTKENIIRVGFNEKLVIGQEKNERGELRFVNGKTVPLEAYVIDWAVEKNRELFYNQKIDCYYDMKLDKQLNNMVGVRQSNRIKYTTKNGTADHLHAAFLVFNIARFLKEDVITPKNKNSWGTGIIG